MLLLLCTNGTKMPACHTGLYVFAVSSTKCFGNRLFTLFIRSPIDFFLPFYFEITHGYRLIVVLYFSTHRRPYCYEFFIDGRVKRLAGGFVVCYWPFSSWAKKWMDGVGRLSSGMVSSSSLLLTLLLFMFSLSGKTFPPSYMICSLRGGRYGVSDEMRERNNGAAGLPFALLAKRDGEQRPGGLDCDAGLN